jgi:hypothetical protein
MKHEIELDEISEQILQEIVDRQHASKLEADPLALKPTTTEYIQTLISNWFGNRKEQILTARAEEHKRRYLADAAYRDQIAVIESQVRI